MVFLFIALLHWPHLKEKNKYDHKINLFSTLLTLKVLSSEMDPAEIRLIR
jgi:hypothetical protein